MRLIPGQQRGAASSLTHWGTPKVGYSSAHSRGQNVTVQQIETGVSRRFSHWNPSATSFKSNEQNIESIYLKFSGVPVVFVCVCVFRCQQPSHGHGKWGVTIRRWRTWCKGGNLHSVFWQKFELCFSPTAFCCPHFALYITDSELTHCNKNDDHQHFSSMFRASVSIASECIWSSGLNSNFPDLVVLLFIDI